MIFSERFGLKPVKTVIQLYDMDDDLRNGLWNAFLTSFIEPIKKNSDYYKIYEYTKYKYFFHRIWIHYFKKPIDDIPGEINKIVAYLREIFFTVPWNEIYDFIEFLAKNRVHDDQRYPLFNNDKFTDLCNLIMKKEVAGYRFIDNEIAPITDENEINEIEQALSKASSTVKVHLGCALDKLSDRQSPDYRNSIKESISAVESICKQIAGDPKAELGKALKKLKEKINLHGSLEKGFTQIYGYTSDGDGIRHALSEESEIDFEDAKYMLVACSAFVNYLIIKAQKAGINI